ncbi:sensor histidine kinase [Sulfitobacter sp. JBTF-M27]|uniref:histidine kinase n=2 Tax=Sulfitobacter sediminilitoris TaxID=2698830 RepID=A0A6P0C8S1_9RHOB|nr:HAMP domain-containing sensor histidine kinase [Sulfitobacter sediminilitoris]NEK22599.1 sensor histidine kinase [Sulfitobacter sediminilitoris]
MKDRIRQLWRSMPIRLAILLVALFAVVSLLSLAASYAVTQSSFEQTIRADLRQDLAGFRAAPNARAVALLVDAESREADPNRLILSYIGPDGRIYGNGAIAQDDEGFHIFSLNPERAQFSGDYLSLTDTLYGGLITVARSRAEIVALRDVFVNILLISLLPTVLIALSGGLILARRSKRHVEVVSSALDRMTSGDLGARVTIGPRWSDDLVRIGGKLNQMAGAQEAQMKALKGVSSDIAHDLKTPLQRVAVYLEELEAKVDEDGEVAALVSKTQDEVNDMTRVFQSLLQLAQVEAGSPRNRFEKVDLAQVCRTVVEVFEPSAVASHHHLTLTADLEEAFIKGDRALLGQMLSNLIENALRHTPDGSHVSVQLTAQDGQLKLIVADNGPGIPADEKDKVVQRLYRLDRSRHTPGHGLGLSLVEAVAGLHGATVELADNAPGLRVELSFPR